MGVERQAGADDITLLGSTEDNDNDNNKGNES